MFPGLRVPGRMGGERVTTKNLRVVKVDEENNLLYLRGAVPGPTELRHHPPGQAWLRRAEESTMKITVRNLANKKVREIDLPEAVFAYPYNEHLIHEAVQAYLAGQRRGTHKTKTRAEVSGSGRKLWRQKGTGRARVGDIRNPLWRKGGTVHGPQPRDYGKDLSAREKRNALKSALSQKVADERLVVLDDLELGSHRTAELAATLGGLGLDGKVLLVDRHDNDNLSLAARNNRALKTVDALGVNVYDVVDRNWCVVSSEALDRLVEVLAK